MSNLEKYLDKLVHAVSEAKGELIKAYYISETSPLTDYAVIVSVKNPLHGNAIVNAINTAFQPLKTQPSDDLYFPPKRSGKIESGWLVLDFNSIVVHIILEDLRFHYELDQIFEPQSTHVEHG